MPKIPLQNQVELNNLQQTTTCLNCWNEFLSDEVRFVATHPDMESEPQLPQLTTRRTEPRRIIPERFNAEGQVLDPMGSICSQVACPACKLTIPRMSIELPPVIFSVLGEKGSGKSIFIASMIFAMRQKAGAIGIQFQDADLALNHTLIENERKLFLDASASSYRKFSDVVEATAVEDDDSWRKSNVEGVERRYLPPYSFRIAPTPKHPSYGRRKNLEKILCLYDNAGEHFSYKASSDNRFMTGHLARSSGLIFTYDPTQDSRFRKVLKTRKAKGGLGRRQDIFLLEAANRIREQLAGTLSARDQIPQPLVVALTKFDMWMHALGGDVPESLYEKVTDTRFESVVSDDVKNLSGLCRQLLIDQGCREIVDSAESVSSDVTYCPVAAVGTKIRMGSEGELEFRMGDEGPLRSEIPLLCLLNRSHRALFPTCKRKQRI